MRILLARSATKFGCAFAAAALCLLTAPPLPAQQVSLEFPGASHVPESRPGWQEEDPDAPLDEAQGGMTWRGTPISKRNEECFPAENRNLFSEVDRVPSGPDRALHPLDYSDGAQGVTPLGRNAIRGHNTWMLWGEGNEAFWGWLGEQGYGLVDFMILLDSRQRDRRFANAGLMNQPGFVAQTDPDKRLLGLYLDRPDGDAVKLKQPAGDVDAASGKLAQRPAPPPDHATKHTQLFEPGDAALYESVLKQLPDDGLDPDVYGYASGVIGLRLMPNPDFFGKTDAAATARAKWDREVTHAPLRDAYYTDASINADPDLIRPFRVSMSCAFCHAGPHPLDPPADVEHPAWGNVSSTIGNQYWDPRRNFANLIKPDNFLYHFLASQQMGTIDTSLVSTDHINNANTINAVFDVPQRLARALLNPAETQSKANQLLPGVEDPNGPANPRRTPRVLLDGADSVGVFGALARVYLNIGTFPQEWSHCHNPIIGFKPQRPFSIATLQKNSVYWRTAVKYRVPYLAAFFTVSDRASGASVTQPMHLADAPGGKALLAPEAGAAGKGREVFIEHCAICHSSKQPDNFALDFAQADWKHPAQAPPAGTVVMPHTFADWEDFKHGPAYREYVKSLRDYIASHGGEDAFLADNFLSTDIRVPITLVGTNSGRAVGTNGMRGQVWDNFSSDTYKELPAVGEVHFYNPYSGKPLDAWGNNDVYTPPPGGPGYYRPASLISLWATAPYLHNNALGLYDQDPSVAGRLRAFDDGIDKLLWKNRRGDIQTRREGDLRGDAAFKLPDPGFVYRTTQVTYIAFGPKFVRPLLSSLLGPTLTALLERWLWIGLAVLFAILAIFAVPRQAGFVALLIAVALTLVVVIVRLDKVYWWIWLLPLAAAALTVWLWVGRKRPWLARTFFMLLALGSLGSWYFTQSLLAGERGELKLGPVPEGTPVNLIMNMNPEAPTGDLVHAGASMLRAFLMIEHDDAKGAAALAIFEHEAGPALLRVSKCPDFVLDRGHWFGEALSDEDKTALKAFLKTL